MRARPGRGSLTSGPSRLQPSRRHPATPESETDLAALKDPTSGTTGSKIVRREAGPGGGARGSLRRPDACSALWRREWRAPRARGLVQVAPRRGAGAGISMHRWCWRCEGTHSRTHGGEGRRQGSADASSGGFCTSRGSGTAGAQALVRGRRPGGPRGGTLSQKIIAALLRWNSCSTKFTLSFLFNFLFFFF